MANAWVRMRHPDYDTLPRHARRSSAATCGSCRMTRRPRVAPVPVRRVDPPEDWTADALHARLDRGEPFPVVGDGICVFAFHGPAIRVRMVHFGVGLPDDLDFGPVGDWWLLALRFPPGRGSSTRSRSFDSFGTHLIEDPLNPLVARHPFGGNSVCEAEGYREREWAVAQPGTPAGTIRDLEFRQRRPRPARRGVGVPAGWLRPGVPATATRSSSFTTAATTSSTPG